MGPDLDVVFITGLHNHFTFYEIIRIIHEEGAAVVIANFSAVGNSTLHVVHPKIGEFGFNFGASRLSERLKMFVCGSAGEVESQPELWDFEIQPDIWQFDMGL
ncbi:hypothetical protein F0562_010790 [Nyssa sinensis]|uniref:Uncharacterized protein n=1 Tax=Nyssa sinensis TaxID=561372 RepID=A0A5J5A4Z2_9ASTE|nr:hypothetical protein F0562_010790 [Nyssa sinensis]